jgi:predicted metal-dependent phosphoesterase TrpH
MTSTSRRILLAAGLGLGLAVAHAGSGSASGAAPAQSAPPPGPLHWYKGNTHTHTINNGGDSTPDEVVRWYREHGYQFLVLTDHNFLTRVDALNALHGADEKFLVVPGEEVTSRAGDKPVHVNGLDVQQLVPAAEGSDIQDVLQRNIDGIRAARGVPHINHPNFGWALTADHLRQARNYRLVEIHSGHPGVNNLGGGGVPGMEEVWDRLLTAGTTVYGIAVDDAHTFKDPGNPTVSAPGRGWVTVRAPRLEARALMDALERGDFYASTGVVLEDVRATARDLTVKVKVEGAARYRIQFIGRGGALLREATEPAATYTFSGDEGYVRAKVIESNGRLAWVQPVRVGASASTARGIAAILGRWLGLV